MVSSSSQWASSMTAMIGRCDAAVRSHDDEPVDERGAADHRLGRFVVAPPQQLVRRCTDLGRHVDRRGDERRQDAARRCRGRAGRRHRAAPSRPPASRSASSASNRVLPAPGSPSIQTIGSGRSSVGQLELAADHRIAADRDPGDRHGGSSAAPTRLPLEVEQILARQQPELGERPPCLADGAQRPRYGGRRRPVPSPAAASAPRDGVAAVAGAAQPGDVVAGRDPMRGPRAPTAPRPRRPARRRRPPPASPTARRRRRRTGARARERGRVDLLGGLRPVRAFGPR